MARRNRQICQHLTSETDEMSDIQLKALDKHLQKVKELCTKIQDATKGQRLEKIHQRY